MEASELIPTKRYKTRFVLDTKNFECETDLLPFANLNEFNYIRFPMKHKISSDLDILYKPKISIKSDEQIF